MKKVVFYAMIAVFLVLFSGCGGNESGSNTTPKNSNKVSENKEAQENKSTNEEGLASLPQFSPVTEGDTIVTMKTSMGDIVLKLFPDLAPKAVENFVTHSKNGYYNGLTFHRVISDFMIQGGDPNGNGTGGESIWEKPFEDEFSPKLFNFRGALSMANSGPNTNGSQFFIVQAKLVDEELVDQMKQAGFFPKAVIEKYKEVGGTPWLDHKHTVFGQVVEGMDVLDKIASVKVDSASAPLEPITIKEMIVKEK